MLYAQVSPATTESQKSRNSSSLLVVKRRWVEWEEVWQQEAFLARFFTFFTVIERKTLAQVHSTVGWSDLALLFQNPSTLQLCVSHFCFTRPISCIFESAIDARSIHGLSIDIEKNMYNIFFIPFPPTHPQFVTLIPPCDK